MSETRALHLVVGGRVQGVGFRWFVRNAARALELAGRVRNLPDGRVEACFEGAADAVDRMVAWCRHGPAQASVTGIEVFEEPPRGELGFD